MDGQIKSLRGTAVIQRNITLHELR